MFREKKKKKMKPRKSKLKNNVKTNSFETYEI